MKIYKGIISFADGREFEDLYITKEDALSYYGRANLFDGCLRAVVFEMVASDEGVTRFEEGNCIYEFDANGKYYYNVA